MPKITLWGGGAIFFILCIKVGIVTPHLKGQVALTALVPNLFFCLFDCSGCANELKFQASTKDFVVTVA